jgi:membrane-bound ClpP family serine protease
MRRAIVLIVTILVLISTKIVLAQSAARASGGASSAVIDFVLNPWVTSALMFLGMALIIAEFVSIGSWGSTGTAGVACIGCVVGSSVLAGVAATTGVVLLLVGTALMLVESRVLPGRGVSAVAGLACLFMGLFWTLGGVATGLAYAASISAMFTVMAAIAFLVHLPTNGAWSIAGRRVEMHEQHHEAVHTGHARITRLEPETTDEPIPGHDADLRHTKSDDDDQIVNRNG